MQETMWICIQEHGITQLFLILLQPHYCEHMDLLKAKTMKNVKKEKKKVHHKEPYF